MGSSSSSLRAGIIGELNTPTGTPASVSVRIAASRRAGEVARGSIVRAREIQVPSDGTYAIRFVVAEGTDFVGLASGRITLRFASPAGRVECKWYSN